MVVCPYCKNQVDGSNIKTEEISKRAFKFKVEMYSCPHCNAFLGIASIG
jgi:uncharacterized protein YbaR (Trm112 family)